MASCAHLTQIQQVTPSASGCEECLKIGDHWVHLRLCMICGHVGCCDNSKNKHATKHFYATQHPSSDPLSGARTGVGATMRCFSNWIDASRLIILLEANSFASRTAGRPS